MLLQWMTLKLRKDVTNLMYFIYDTETTGFPLAGVSHNNPNQARIVQLAWLVLDEHLDEVACFSSLVKPVGSFKINPGAQAAHGISNDMCVRYGLPAKEVMDLLHSARKQCKSDIAHNIKFDRQLLDIEDKHAYGYPVYSISTLKEVCTMELMTPICKLPPTGNRSGYKWPKLTEAYKYVTGQELKGAHDALADVRGCVEVLRWLVANRHVELGTSNTFSKRDGEGQLAQRAP